VIRTALYLVTLVWATIWYGGRCIVAGWLRVPWTRGGLYDRAQRYWARSILAAAGIPVTVEGAEHLAPDAPQIVAANHASFFDILALLGWLPGDPKFIAKKEIFAIPVMGGAMKAAGHVRMDRGHQKQAFDAYVQATGQLRERRLTVVVYPEGTRTRTGELGPFKKGAFVFAIVSGAPVVPCYVSGAFGIQPKGRIRVHRQPIRITLGAPIGVDGLTVEDREALAERVRQAVLALGARVDASRVAS